MYANKVIMNIAGDNDDPRAQDRTRASERERQIITKIFLYSKYTQVTVT